MRRLPRGALGAAALAGLAAFALRLWVLRDMEAQNPLFGVPALDEAVYLEMARDGAPGPTLVSKLHPLLLRAVGATTRHAAAVLGAAVGAATAATAALAAARLGRSAAAGAVAGTLVAGAGALVFHDVTVGTEALVSLLTLCSAWALAEAAAFPHGLLAAGGGAAVALAAAARANSLALLTGALPALRRRPRLALGLGAGLVAVLLPLAAATDLLPTSGGVNLWLANNEWSRRTRSLGTDEFPMDPVTEAHEVRRIAERDAGRPLSTAEVNAWWTRRALAEMAQAPAEAAEHFAAKLALAFSADEIPGNHDPVAERGYAAATRFLPVTAWWLLAAGAAGWWLARRAVPAADAVALGAAGLLATLVLLFPLARYRLPALPLCAVLAGLGTAAVLRREVPRRRAAGAAVVGAAIAATAFAALLVRGTERPESWTNLAQAARTTGLGDPRALAERAVAEDPEFLPAHALLGHLALDARRNEEALRRYDAALAPALADRWPALRIDATLGRARALANLGRREAALRAHDELLAERPGDARLWAESALVASEVGAREEAARRLRRAREIDPAEPHVVEVGRRLR